MDSDVASILIKIGGKKLTATQLGYLKSFNVKQDIGSNATATLTFFDGFTELQENSRFAIGKEIAIEIGNTGKTQSIFKGDVKKIKFDSKVEAADEIVLTCHDFLHRLSKIKKNRNFDKKKLSDIAGQMAGEAKLRGNKIQATTQVYEQLVQKATESNLAFLRRFADDLGYEVDLDDGGGLFFKKARHMSAKKSGVVLEWGKSLIDFNAELSLDGILTEVTVSSVDIDKKTKISETAKAGDEKKIGSPKIMGTKEAKKNLKGTDTAELIIDDRPSLTKAQAKSMAVAKLTEESMNYLQADGECVGEPKFKLGTLVEIKGVGKKLSGDYYVTSYTHTYNSAGLKTSFEMKANGTF